MSRIGIVKLVVCWCLLGLLSSCGGTPQTTATTTLTPAVVVATKTPTPYDMTPVVRDFLSKLPTDWNLVASQDVAAKKSFIVDVRQPDEYSKGFIEGAVNIPIRELAHSLQALPALDKDIVLVCDTGHRSAIGMTVLQMLGYQKAKSLAGGMQAWQAAKLPVVTQPVPAKPSGPAPPVDAKVQTALNQYLTEDLPEDWGLITPSALVEDQAKKSNLELEAQPDHYEQGASILVDVNEPDMIAKGSLPKAINIPLRGLVDNLGKIPEDKITLWA
jgi:rhodanese-related sulfurtransferase